MLTKDDLSQIGIELGKVIERIITPQFDAVNTCLNRVEERLTIVEHKLDRALYHELNRHERWIRQLAAKVGIELTCQ